VASDDDQWRTAATDQGYTQTIFPFGFLAFGGG
jgi:hypothetical protein